MRCLRYVFNLALNAGTCLLGFDATANPPPAPVPDVTALQNFDLSPYRSYQTLCKLSIRAFSPSV